MCWGLELRPVQCVLLVCAVYNLYPTPQTRRRTRTPSLFERPSALSAVAAQHPQHRLEGRVRHGLSEADAEARRHEPLPKREHALLPRDARDALQRIGVPHLAELRLQMRVEISDLHAELGNTMIYVTHDQIEAMTMADRIVVLRDGNIEQIGKPLELYNHPANKFVAGFIGAPQMNFMAGSLDGKVLKLDNGITRDVPVRETGTAQPVTLGVRPETIDVSLDGHGDEEIIVQNFEQLGSVTYIYGTFANGETLTVQLAQQIPIERGQTVGVTLHTKDFHIFGGENERSLPMDQ